MIDSVITAESDASARLEPTARESSTWPRRLGRLGGQAGHPTLLLIGGLHGNEPAGVLAIQRVFERLKIDQQGLLGEVVGLIGNRQALATRKRFLVKDLNRHWTRERVEALPQATGELQAEDLELVELSQEINEVLQQARGEVYAVDLHTTSSHGACFAILDDTLPNRAFALPVPTTLVVGIEEELAGTLTYHLDLLGMRVFCFESGQHDDPASVDNAEAAIWIALEACGVLAPGTRPEVLQARRLLQEISGHLPHVVEVRYRHAVTPSDDFRMESGFLNLQPVAAGELLARDGRGPILSPETGLILMPLYQAQGEDGFFIVRRLRSFWLRLSAVVRRSRLERFVHWLPGVRRHPELADTFVADRRYARFGALELFHLLGYRRTGPGIGRHLLMTRRAHDPR